MGTAASVRIGYPGALGRYTASPQAVATTGGFTIASNGTSNFGDVLTKDQVIQAIVEGATWAGGQAFYGWIDYLQQ